MDQIMSLKSKQEELSVYQEMIRLMEEREKLKEELPYLHKLKHYEWSRKFFESRAKKNVLVAANQLGKSTTQIRKCIDWATDTDKWGELWPEVAKKGLKPNLFWYLYPTKQLASEEFLTKWTPLLPQGEKKKCPKYGWKDVWSNGEIYGVEFNSGVLLIFKTYAQKAQDLQAGSVHALFIDEEPPIDIVSELLMRTSGVDGYIHAVFTATLNQDFFRRVIEPREDEIEEWKDALKLQISLYDSQYFDDGTPSEWTDKRIEQSISRCTTPSEVQRRIFGKFVTDTGVRIHTYDPSKHFIPRHLIPEDWLYYSAVDFGTGVSSQGRRNHPSAILFIAVSPDFKMGRVFRGKRFDMQPMTTIQLASEYVKLKGDLKTTAQAYDWHSAEFEVHARALGQHFVRANKYHDLGTDLVRSLFKANMLKIFDTPELTKLSGELQSLSAKVNKIADSDDFFDTLRYACMLVPWDLSEFKEGFENNREIKNPEPLPELTELDYRRRFTLGTNVEDKDEFDEWNELY